MFDKKLLSPKQLDYQLYHLCFTVTYYVEKFTFNYELPEYYNFV